jgi:hypothetical protein
VKANIVDAVVQQKPDVADEPPSERLARRLLDNKEADRDRVVGARARKVSRQMRDDLEQVVRSIAIRNNYA